MADDELDVIAMIENRIDEFQIGIERLEFGCLVGILLDGKYLSVTMSEYKAQQIQMDLLRRGFWIVSEIPIARGTGVVYTMQRRLLPLLRRAARRRAVR